MKRDFLLIRYLSDQTCGVDFLGDFLTWSYLVALVANHHGIRCLPAYSALDSLWWTMSALFHGLFKMGSRATCALGVALIP